MNLDDAFNELSIRLYGWSQNALWRELEEGCPLLRLVATNNRRIGGFVSWNNVLSSRDRQQLAAALTFSSHGAARETKSGFVGDKTEYWQKEYYSQTTIHMNRLPPHTVADINLLTFHPLDVDVFLDGLAGAMPSMLGETTRKKSSVWCSKQIGDWRLITEFNYERRYKNLTYAHAFVRKDDKNKIRVQEIAPGRFPRSLFTFWGLYNRTVVALDSMQDAEPMIVGFTKLAEHFASQAELLFSGLEAVS